jgi:uncharacterized protein (DUF697 family)
MTMDTNGQSGDQLLSPIERRIAELSEKRREAEAWVNGYTATGAAIVFAAILPGGATVVLCGLEVTMCYHIGRIYSTSEWTMGEATKAAATVGLAALAGKILALEGALLLGPFGIAARPVIAAGIIKAMGQLVIRYFEEKSHVMAIGASSVSGSIES